MPVQPRRFMAKVAVAPGCVDACKTHRCANNGKCLNRFSSIGCDCSLTMFQGRNCTDRK